VKSRSYHQTARAATSSENTERILAAARDLFVERPFDQITLAAVAERAGVGLQTVIRRVGTKDGLVQAVGTWIAPQVARDLGAPSRSDPDFVAAAFRRHYTAWAAVLERSLAQEDSSPSLKANAVNGREGHRGWISTAFATELAALAPADREILRGRLVAVTGVELWLVLTKHEGLSPGLAEATVSHLIRAVLTEPTHVTERKQP
jgi:AcrR family transcriptional regulator